MKAYILAGGNSSRMGEDKGLKTLLGRPMISYMIDALLESGNQIHIVSKDTRYETFSYPLITDKIAGVGPMGGIHAAMMHAEKEDEILICACDMPLIRAEHIHFLIGAYQKNSIVSQYQQRVQPLLAIYNTSLLANIEKKIASNELKLQKFLLDSKVDFLEFENDFTANPFQNINTAEDLEQIAKIMYD